MKMNKCENIFTQVGKQTPFRTPEGFFSEQEQTLKKAISSQPSVVRPLRRKWWYAAAASALLLIAVYPVIRLVEGPSATDSAPIYSQTSPTSDDWSDFADADIFMDNMNW